MKFSLLSNFYSIISDRKELKKTEIDSKNFLIVFDLHRLIITDLCSHRRSFEFYAESVRNNTAFIGKCANFQVWGCDGVPFIPMGYTTPNNALVFYFH